MDNQKFLESFFARGEDLVTREISGETIVVPVRTRPEDPDAIYTLNELGTVIWRLLDGRIRGAEIVEAVCGEYDADPEAVRQDAAAFLCEMEEAGLIKKVPSTESRVLSKKRHR
jgi:hypothetical protein